MYRTRLSTRLISTVLAVLFVIYVYPFMAIAETLETAEEVLYDALTPEEIAELYDSTESIPEADVVGENTNLREETVKHYRMSDGTYRAVDYGKSVHFADENGQWVDYDNDLLLNEAKDSSDPDDFAGYEPEKSDVKIKFAKNTSSSNLFKIKYDDVQISFGLKYALHSTPVIDNGEIDLSDPYDVPGVKSSITYPDVFEGVDLVYVVDGSDVKEYFVISEDATVFEYTFDIKVKNVVPSVDDSGNVVFTRDDGTAVYTIPKGYMYDSGTGYSDNVTYTVVQEGNKKYTMTVTADDEWISDEDRVYPVYVDPTVVLNKYAGGTANGKIETGYKNITSGSEYEETDHVYVGTTIGEENNANFIVKELPTLPANTILCNAFFLAYHRTYSYVGLTELYIGAYEPQSSSNKYSPLSPLLDYAVCTGANVYSFIQFDVTPLARGWYDGTKANNGVVFAAINNTPESYAHTILTGCYSAESFLSPEQPRFVISYRHTAGIESYYSYETVGVGRAGSVYLNTNTGQSVIVNDLITTNNLAVPYSVSLVYNSVYSRTQFTNNVTAGIHTADYTNMKLGAGWKLNSQISVKEITLSSFINGIETTYLIFCDGDGTEHYFAQSADETNIYVDEDGLGLQIEILSDTTYGKYKMTDDKNNVTMFSGTGYVVSSTDSNGNKVTYNYDTASDKRKLLSISVKNDGGSSVTVATFGYNSNNYLTSVTDQYGKVTTFTYNNATPAELTEITCPDGAKCSYLHSQFVGYNNSNRKPAKIVDNESGYGVRLYYENGGNRVVELQEYVGTKEGSKLSFTYTGSERTEVRYSGNDGTLDTSDDVSNVYLFDYFGRCVNIHSIDPETGKIYGASAAAYTNPVSSTSKKKNRVEVSASTGIQPLNLLMNAGAEALASSTSTIAAYFYRPTLASGQTVAQSTAVKHTGTASMKVSATTASSTGPYTYYIMSGLTVGNEYTFSAYAKSSDIVASTTSGGYCLWAGSTYSPRLNKAIDTANDDGWVKLSVTFTATSTSMSLYAGLINAQGTVYFDDFQLTADAEADQISLIPNGGFDNSANRYWSLDNGQFTTAEAFSGTTSIKITGSPDDTSSAWYIVPINRSAEYTYVYSGWTKASSVPLVQGDKPNKPSYCLSACVKYTDNTTEWHSKSFSSDYTGGWQYLSMPIAPKFPGKTVSSIVLYLSYDYNGNSVYFDNVSLVAENAAVYKYDDNGNVVAASSTKQSEVTSTYNGADLTGYTAATGANYSYTYDSAHNVKTATWAGITNTYTYNAAGLVTGSTLTGGSNYISTSATYDGYGKLTSETDQLGYTTSYAYNSANGALLSTTMPDDSEMLYGTNPNNNRPTSVIYANCDGDYESEVTMGYVSGRLSEISQTPVDNSNPQTYHLSYNAFGDMTSLTVGDIVLAENTYNQYTGALLTSKTPSGSTLSYEYDILGRPVSVLNGTTSLYTTRYNAHGNVASSTDVTKGITRSYLYDSIGRTTGVMDRITANVFKQFVSYSYDSANRLTQRSINMDFYPSALTDSFTYDTNGLLSSMVSTYGDTFTPVYNGLKQVSGVAVAQTGLSGYSYTKNYTYKTVSGNRTSNLPTGITYSFGNAASPLTYSYTYDNMYNITGVTKNGSTEASYGYDLYGKLESATVGSDQYAYYYDLFGNITAITRIEDYTISRRNLVYDTTSGWRDRLVSVNGTAITYSDTAPGLPTSYYNGEKTYSFVWNSLGQLHGGVVDNKAIMYEYNSDGLRTFRRGGSNSYNYYYEGDRLVAQKWGGNKYILFHYDESESIYAITYCDGTTTEKYNLFKNLQGDVVEVRSKYNALLASYNYDPWGNIVSVTDSSGNEITDTTHIAHINPIRYRSYYYDDDTGFYYLQSRYYDPELGRFISADDPTVATNPLTVTDKNLFAYCDNNPIVRADDSGEFWETFFDIISLALSTVEVCVNPTDPMAWAGLAGDAVDLIPFVTGVGETIRTVNTIDKVADLADTTYDVIKSTNRVENVIDVSANGIRYTDKVLKQMENVADLHHSFPTLIDTFIDIHSVRPLIGGDGIMRNMIELHGSINNTPGVFEYIIEPNGMCNHRYFREIK